MSNPLIGKKVVSVDMPVDKLALRFNLEGGESIFALTDAECCSSTWIESVESPENLIGTVVAVEDIAMPEPVYDKAAFDCLEFYGCKITTEKGSCLIDYRNESNGYYGGSLVWPREHDHGEVFWRSVHESGWKEIAK